MRRIRKKIACGVLAALIIWLMTAAPVAAGRAIQVYVFNKPVAFDVSPVMVNGHVMVPARSIFEALGAVVEWDEETETLNVQKDNREIDIISYEDYAVINDFSRVALKEPARIINDRFMVPLGFAGRVFDTVLKWDDKTSTAYIDLPPWLDPKDYKLETLAVLDWYIERPDFVLTPNGKLLVEGRKAAWNQDSKQVLLYCYDIPTMTVTDFTYFDNQLVTLFANGKVIIQDNEDIAKYVTKTRFSVYDAMTGETKVLGTVERHKYDLYFSRQGDIIYDVADIKKNQSDYYKMDLQGRITRLTFTPDIIEGDPSWAPDGKRIAFISYPKYGNKTHYYSVLATQGKGEIKLSKFPATDGSDLYWSPDGQYLAYRVSYPQGMPKERLPKKDNYGIWVIKADGTSGKRILQTREQFLDMMWSPDGKKLIARNDAGFIMLNADGTGLKRFEGRPLGLSPDGKRLMYYDSKGVTWLHEIAGDKASCIPIMPDKLLWGANSKEVYFTSENIIYKLTLAK